MAENCFFCKTNEVDEGGDYCSDACARADTPDRRSSQHLLSGAATFGLPGHLRPSPFMAIWMLEHFNSIPASERV